MRPKNIKFILLLVIAGFTSNGFCQSNENNFLKEKGIQRERLKAIGYGERTPDNLPGQSKGKDSFLNKEQDSRIIYQLFKRS